MSRLLVLVSALLLWAPAAAGERFVTLASTTSTENSGLFDALLPQFSARTGIGVRVVAVGTGQALKLARNGDADVLLVHDRSAEQRFVAEGYGVQRFDVMYNDFVIVGPGTDPARISGLRDVAAALARVAAARSVFVSRGDDSGTHRRERALWQAAAIDVAAASGTWYRESGSGMGATLNLASGLDAYTLSDRATWLKFANRGRLRILVEGDARLHNQYGVILVDPRRHPHVKAADGQALIDWLLSVPGQQAIDAYRIGATQAFFANGARVAAARRAE